VGNGVLLAQLLRRHFNTFVVGLDGLVKFAEIFVLHCHVVVAHGEDGRFGVVAKVVEHARRHTARVALALEQLEGALAVLKSVPMSIEAREDGAQIQVCACRVVGFGAGAFKFECLFCKAQCRFE